MLPRPDSQSFTRFLVSVGAFLCVAAFVGPGLVLRDTDVLSVSSRQLAAMTPTGRAEVERRQRVARTAGEIAPYVGAALLFAGIGLLLLAVPRLRRQERTDEARSTVELAQLRAALKPQSEEERERTLEADARAEAEIAVEHDGGAERAGIADRAPVELRERSAVALPMGVPDPIQETSALLRAHVERARAVEEQILDRIEALGRPRYALSRNVKLERTRRRLLLDGLLVSRTDDLPDLLVEIKYTSNAGFKNNLGNRLDEAVSKVVRYRSQLGRVARVWLILVSEEPLSPSVDRRARAYAREFAGDLILSTVWSGELDALQLPQLDVG